ncbi:hypothetical protein [Nocardia africana]
MVVARVDRTVCVPTGRSRPSCSVVGASSNSEIGSARSGTPEGGLAIGSDPLPTSGDAPRGTAGVPDEVVSGRSSPGGYVAEARARCGADALDE